MQLQEQVQALQVSLASQRDLSLVGASQEEVDLREEVFNFIPGMVNTNRGAAGLSFTQPTFPVPEVGLIQEQVSPA